MEEIVSTMTQAINVLEEEGAEVYTNKHGGKAHKSWKVTATYLPAFKVLHIESVVDGDGESESALVAKDRATAVRTAVACADDAKAKARKAADEAETKVRGATWATSR